MVEEAIAFYEVCIKLKGKLRSHNKIDMMKCYELLGLECLKAELATVAMRPETEIALEGDQAESMQKLLDALENLDDVQEVFTNAAL